MNDPFDPTVPQMTSVASICRCPPGQHGRPGVGSTSYSDYDPPGKPAPGTGYEIEQIEEVGNHLVMRVNFKCSFEGSKLMVFMNTKVVDAIMWKKIDPHFTQKGRNERRSLGELKREAPIPSARFPATPEGWADAVSYARGKSK